jgi:hypothetical protein
VRRTAAALLLACAGATVVASAGAPREAKPVIDRMLRPIIEAHAVTAQVVIERSDPFGGPPERSSGRVWYQPGRGLRVRFDRGGGEEIVADRTKGAFFLYRVAEGTVYRAPWERAPRRLRRLVEEPGRILDADLRARAEARVMGGRTRDGFRLREASLGDSAGPVTTWVGADPGSGLLRWIALAAEDDSVSIELRGIKLLSTARARDIALSAPRSAPVEPLDPHELLPERESR